MLLVIDVGNTNTVLGVFRLFSAPDFAEAASENQLVAHWRVSTNKMQTVDEYGVLFRTLLTMAGLDTAGIKGIIISSVVPPLDSTLREVCERYFNLRPFFIEPGVKTGMPVQYNNPAEVGADRIVNAVAAFHKYGGPCIVVDFGTATTFDAISEEGAYLGGAIAPGVGISADALFEHAARLPRVEIRQPKHIIGTDTIASMQAGLFYGYLGLVEGILRRMIAELGGATKVIATGGLSVLFGSHCSYINAVDDLLTLEGLRIIWERNQPQGRSAGDTKPEAGSQKPEGGSKQQALRKRMS
jgi:type III pantothenate kinase